MYHQDARDADASADEDEDEDEDNEGRRSLREDSIVRGDVDEVAAGVAGEEGKRTKVPREP